MRIKPRRFWRVVGINLPTFVERAPTPRPSPSPRRVSSGLTSRPSLSGPARAALRVRLRRVSSGLTSRPSLSAAPCSWVFPHQNQVSSGLTSRPSLSEPTLAGAPASKCRVVGINLPTFVERPRARNFRPSSATVSSGLTSRPSLSVERGIGAGPQPPRCRRD